MALIRKKARSFRRRPTRKLTLKKLAKVVRSRRPEQKYSLLYSPATAVGVAGTMYNLSSIAQGDTAVTRSGLWVKPTTLDLRALAYDSTQALSYGRFILFQWRGNTVDPPTPGKLLLNQSGGANPTWQSIVNPIFKEKIRLLSDRVVAFPQYTAAATTAKGIQWHYKMRIPKGIKYQDDLGTNYETGNLFLFAMATTATATMALEGILRYTDV